MRSTVLPWSFGWSRAPPDRARRGGNAGEYGTPERSAKRGGAALRGSRSSPRPSLRARRWPLMSAIVGDSFGALHDRSPRSVRTSDEQSVLIEANLGQGDPRTILCSIGSECVCLGSAQDLQRKTRLQKRDRSGTSHEIPPLPGAPYHLPHTPGITRPGSLPLPQPG
ncbi:hypothetical protein CDCA_CDCA16G4291 [Cyanidium caldarium]|uniref:Uncharacterized protein n=1 Tax=Cyanidium caldarium TaxID=2771 RepID=A0AAV9J1L9_CYACA|nr:hypothetical protein CDCA_CDCA16G4291 [Cyanidium caldarium]|eukprot:ctg_1776.g529